MNFALVPFSSSVRMHGCSGSSVECSCKCIASTSRQAMVSVPFVPLMEKLSASINASRSCSSADLVWFSKVGSSMSPSMMESSE